MLKYGTDKPDLRNPIEIFDVTKIMQRDDVKLDIFKNLIAKGGVVRAIPAPNTLPKPRSFFDGYNNWAKEEGAKGLGYIILEKTNEKFVGKGRWLMDQVRAMELSNTKLHNFYYFPIIMEFCSEFGKNNTELFPLEEMVEDQPGYYKRMAQFTGISELENFSNNKELYHKSRPRKPFGTYHTELIKHIYRSSNKQLIKKWNNFIQLKH